MMNEDQVATVALRERIAESVEMFHRRNAAPLPVEAGSRTSEDDTVLLPYNLSHSVTGAIASALDHFLALDALVRTPPLPMAAPYTLMRAGLENAALAIWLLNPAEQHERVIRCLLLQIDDAADSNGAREAAGFPHPKSFSERRSEIVSHARQHGVPTERLMGARPGWRSKIVDVGAVSGLGGPELEATWRWLSGYTHGRRWVHLTFGRREQVLEDADGNRQLRISASLPALASAAIQAGALLDLAHELETKARLTTTGR